MTIRDLIKMGANLDDEIFVEAKILDDYGNLTGIYFSYDGVSSNKCVIQEKEIIISANVSSVI